MKDIILRFIKAFIADTGLTQEQAEAAFLRGNCYHFAVILCDIFKGDIVYNLYMGHFVALIGGVYYDITGEVVLNDASPMYTLEGLKLADETEYARIKHNCIHKLNTKIKREESNG